MKEAGQSTTLPGNKKVYLYRGETILIQMYEKVL